MGDIQTLILRLLERTGEMSVADIMIALNLTRQRMASVLYSACHRGHISRIPLDDHKFVYSITSQGVRALTVLEALQQRMDEKRHPPRRAPTPEEKAERKPEKLHQTVPYIEPKFALKIARELHRSNVPLDSYTRKKLAQIVAEAA